MYLFRLDCQSIGFSPLNISDEPSGFDNLELTSKRNERYDGISGEFAFDLTFCTAGADYIRRVFDTLGVLGGDVFFIDIHKESRLSENLILRGKILLTSYAETVDGVSVSIAPIDNSFEFVNRLETDVDLFSKTKVGESTETLADLPTVDTIVPSPSYSIITSTLSNKDDLIRCTLGNLPALSILGYVEVYSKICPKVVFDDLFLVDTNNVPNADTPIFKSVFTGLADICFDGELLFELSGSPSGVAGVCLATDAFNNSYINIDYKINNVVISNIYNATSPACIPGTLSPIDCSTVAGFSATIAINFTITQLLNYGDTISFVMTTAAGKEVSASIDFVSRLTATENTYISVKRSIVEDNSISKTLFAKDAFQRVAELISDKTVVSDTFSYDAITNTYGSSGNTVLCNGLMLRNAPDADNTISDTCFTGGVASSKPKWSTNFNKLFDNLSKIYCLGMEIADDVRIERKAFFYGYHYAHKRFNINTGADKFALSFIDKHIYSKFSLGYSNYDDKFYSLREDVHAERTYGNLNKTTENEFDGLSEFIASPQTIVRQKIAEGEADFDEDTFVMVSWGAPMRIPANTYTIQGGSMLYLDLFNMPITPLQNWQRWARFITRAKLQNDATITKGAGNVSACYTNDDSLLPFPINQLLAEDREFIEFGDPICENQALPATDDMSIFSPFEISFETTICLESYREIISKKYGLIELQLDTNGKIYQGWINSIAYKPLTGVAKFKLIMANPKYYKNAYNI